MVTTKRNFWRWRWFWYCGKSGKKITNKLYSNPAVEENKLDAETLGVITRNNLRKRIYRALDALFEGILYIAADVQRLVDENIQNESLAQTLIIDKTLKLL